jgi:hypothetical protein
MILYTVGATVKSRHAACSARASNQRPGGCKSMATAAEGPQRTAVLTLRRWALVLVAAGAAWRLTRYFLRFPIWGDEAFICLNLLDQTYLGLTRPLQYMQIAPVLFLWLELTVGRLLGTSEFALRLPALLAGLGALALFWRLARMCLGRLGTTIAVGLLAISYFPVRHACEVKPYALDLFMALALLTPAMAWSRRPDQWPWLALLAAIVPIAIAASYPSIFIAGAVSLALLPVAWRLQSWRPRVLYATYVLLMVATFSGLYLLVGRAQLEARGARQDRRRHAR